MFKDPDKKVDLEVREGITTVHLIQTVQVIDVVIVMVR
jgi:hypothetical protein